jgi:hypothetical protein
MVKSETVMAYMPANIVRCRNIANPFLPLVGPFLSTSIVRHNDVYVNTTYYFPFQYLELTYLPN